MTDAPIHTDQTHEARGRVRVAVVFGGVSSEHSISCLTAANVVAAMDPDRFEAVGIGISRDGIWSRWSADEILALPQRSSLPEVEEGHPGTGLRRLATGTHLLDQDGGVGERIDVVFPLLHGPFGEDGTIQGLFEMNGVRYVGCGVASSANCMDKHLTKVILDEAGLAVGPYVLIRPHEWLTDRQDCLRRAAALRFPVFVKPARGGSSVGISRVTGPEGVADAVETARRFDPKVLVEQGLAGREIECSVLEGHDGRPPRASVPGEILVHDPEGFYDFDAKYLTDDDLATVAVPARLDQGTADAVRDTAVTAFRVLGCEGLARIDTFVQDDGTVIINEPNTMPGFTRTSGFPLMWQASGMSYRDLISDLVDLALERPVGLR